MKQFAPGLRGGSYSESDDFNMQIEIVNGQVFLDRWAGGGWKNISVHRAYEDALQARAEIRSMIKEWRENEREACAQLAADQWLLDVSPEQRPGYRLASNRITEKIRARGEE